MEPRAIAQQFSDYYYGIFDSDRSQLSGLYRDNSMMTWEGKEYLGSGNIVDRLANLPFEKVQHKITTTDAQPCGGGLLVFFTGMLVVDDSPQPLQFSQTFQLQQNETGTGFWVYVKFPKLSRKANNQNSWFTRSNDIFRLNYG